MKTKRFLAFVMAFVMLFSGLCVSSFADDGAQQRDGKAPFRISVVVNGDTGYQRGFCWYTAEETSSVVEIFNDRGVMANCAVDYADVFEWNGNYVHKALVKGLTPGETFYYKVGDGTTMSEKGSFTTDNRDASLDFIVIADVQAGSPENFEKGANALKAAFEIKPDADFVANLGDFTNDSDNEQWDYYDDAFGALNLTYTLAPVSGNHDGLGVKNWFNNMFNLDTSESVQTKNGVNYSYDYGNAHFAVLNTNDGFSLSNAQLKWLKNDMNSTDKDWKVIFMHKTPYTLGKDGKWPDALYLQRSLTKVADECDVDLVMSGHDHMYLRTKPLTGNKVNENGTTYVLCGTAGSKRYEVREFLTDFFLDTSFIDMLNVQKSGYGNYWNGSDWSSTRDTNVGSCFNCVSIDGGTLTLNSYIVCDETGEVTNVDTYSVTKETGCNKATFSGDNTTSALEQALDVLPSFGCLAVYTFGEWLPKFLLTLPHLISVYIKDGTF